MFRQVARGKRQKDRGTPFGLTQRHACHVGLPLPKDGERVDFLIVSAYS